MTRVPLVQTLRDFFDRGVGTKAADFSILVTGAKIGDLFLVLLVLQKGTRQTPSQTDRKVRSRCRMLRHATDGEEARGR